MELLFVWVKIDGICLCLTDYRHTVLYNAVIFMSKCSTALIHWAIFELSYLKESATFMSSFTLWWVDMPPTLFPVCLGFASASRNFSSYYLMNTTSTQQSENIELSHFNIFLWINCIFGGVEKKKDQFAFPWPCLTAHHCTAGCLFFLICMLGSPLETSWHKTLQYFQMRPAARLHVLAHPVPQDPQTSNQSG